MKSVRSLISEQLLKRDKLYPLPKIKLNPDIDNLMDFCYNDIELIGYQSYERISAPVAV